MERNEFVDWGTLVFGIWYKHKRPFDLWQLKDQIHIEWKDDCPDNIAEERFHFDPKPNNHRPDNWKEIHIWLLERGFIVSHVEDEFEEMMDERWESSSDIPWRLIDGHFGYNEHNVCVAGDILAFSININKRKVYAEAHVGMASHGWAYGLNIGSSFTHAGASGSSHGIWFDARFQYITKEDAILAALYDSLRYFESEKRKAPPAAAKVFQKAIDEIKTKIAFRQEPASFDILKFVPESEPESESKPVLVDRKQPLQLQLF